MTHPFPPAPVRQFSSERYKEILDSTFQEILRLSKLKGGEYAGDDDRLANFRRNAEAADTTMELIWRVYIAKHWDAIMQYEKDIRTGKDRQRAEPIAGRVDDMIVYLLLFKCMIEERSGGRQ
jgi:hypothetical protein